MIEIKAKEYKQKDKDKDNVLNQIERMIKTNDIIKIDLTAELKIHIDDIDQLSDEVNSIIDKYKK